jgi:hypothetical protein
MAPLSLSLRLNEPVQNEDERDERKEKTDQSGLTDDGTGQLARAQSRVFGFLLEISSRFPARTYILAADISRNRQTQNNRIKV